MKKRLSLILAAALCLCVFTGAACDHDWQTAEEVGPKVCSRCGADECEALGHTFQDWEIDGDSMTAWCTVCYQPITEAFDPQTVGEHRLIGKWEATVMSMPGMEINMADFGGMMSVSVTFYDDHTLTVDSNMTVAGFDTDQVGSSNTGTWEFVSYEEDDVDSDVPSLGKLELYNFDIRMDLPEDTVNVAPQGTASVEPGEEIAPNRYILSSNKFEVNHKLQELMPEAKLSVSFEKVDAPIVTSYAVTADDMVELDAQEAIGDNLPGKWYAEQYFNGSIMVPLTSNEKIVLDFADDGSLSFISGGNTVGGSWTLGEATEMAGMRMCFMDIALDDGRTLSGTYTDGSQYMPTLSLDLDGRSYSFVTGEALGAMNSEVVAISGTEAQLIDGLAGVWTASMYTQQSEKSEVDPLRAPVVEFFGDYSLNYTENGQTLNGEWAVRGDIISMGEVLVCDIFAVLDDGTELSFSFNGGINGSVPLIALEDGSDTLIFFAD